MITLRRIFGMLTLLALVACGGGGGGGNDTAAKFDGYEVPLKNVTGAPLTGATVFINDSNDSKTFNCGTTNELGEVTCKVPASFVPPLVVSAVPADVVSPDPTAKTALKTVLTRPTKGTGPNATVPVTPLTTLLVNSDWSYYETNKKNLELVEARLESRKNQITKAIENITVEILGQSKAKTFDFLKDSNFVAGSNDGIDFLLDNISVSFEKGNTFKVSMKKNDKINVVFDADHAKTLTAISSDDAKNNLVKMSEKVLTDFAGVYDIDVTFTSYNSDGSVSAKTQTKSGKLALNSDGTFDSMLETSRWSGKYTLNEKKTSVKISGTVGSKDASGNLVGSIDNDGKMVLAYNTKGSGGNSGQTTKGSVASTKFTNNPAQGVKALSDFAGDYEITVEWRLLDNSASGSDTGTVTIGSDGQVSSCTNFEIFVSCTGTLKMNDKKNGANLSLNATGNVEGVRGAVVVTATVDSAYKVDGTVIGKNENGVNKAEAKFTGSKNQ